MYLPFYFLVKFFYFFPLLVPAIVLVLLALSLQPIGKDSYTESNGVTNIQLVSMVVGVGCGAKMLMLYNHTFFFLQAS